MQNNKEKRECEFENVHFPRYFTVVPNCRHSVYCRFVFSALPGNQRPGLNDGNQAGPLFAPPTIFEQKNKRNKTDFVCHINYILNVLPIKICRHYWFKDLYGSIISSRDTFIYGNHTSQ